VWVPVGGDRHNTREGSETKGGRGSLRTLGCEVRARGCDRKHDDYHRSHACGSTAERQGGRHMFMIARREVSR
jgi:hypothetical protein